MPAHVGLQVGGRAPPCTSSANMCWPAKRHTHQSRMVERRAALSDPSTLSDSDIPARGLHPPSRDARPSGLSGGHTVQDWEQPPPGRRATLSDAVEMQHPASTVAGRESIDEPSPPTVPLYLRGSAATVLA